MQNEVTNALRVIFGLKAHRSHRRCRRPRRGRCGALLPSRRGGSPQPLRRLCGGRLLPALLALTHFPAVFLHSDRGPSRTSVTSQPTGFSISYSFDWKNAFRIYTQAGTALPTSVCKTHRSQEQKELERRQKILFSFAEYPSEVAAGLRERLNEYPAARSSEEAWPFPSGERSVKGALLLSPWLVLASLLPRTNPALRLRPTEI